MVVETASCEFLTYILAFALEQSSYVDSSGQLYRENNQPLGKTYKWVYDSAGNILTKYVYAYSTASTLDNLTPTSVINYSYAANSDRLASYNGQAITYDTVGNPLIYRGNALTWQNGRQLASYGSYSFTYNADGLRIGKTNGNVTTEYVLNGSQVMRQIIDNGTTTYIADYLYHENGTPLGFAYYQENGTPVYYLYETNLQGDVVAIYDSNGVKVVSFTYDAWGNFTANISNSTVCTTSFLSASLFRYRGYIYDYELGLYYLQSRYYDPETGRFLNADGYVSTGTGLLGYNMYLYCNNNPVMFIDMTGEFPWPVLLVILLLSISSTTSCDIRKTSIPKNDEGELVSYNTYQDALNAGNKIVFTEAQMGTPDVLADDVEFMVNIFYNTGDGKFYVSKPYSDYKYDTVEFRKLIDYDRYDKMEVIGYVHYHPSSSGNSLEFSDGDERLADYHDIAAHIINSAGETNYRYRYLTEEKRNWIRGGK